MSAFFVAATGTDIGKTFVTAGLTRHLRAKGRAVDAIKPVVSGFDRSAWQTTDPAQLLAALGREVTLAEAERISPWRFAAPLSPDIAARREDQTIVFSEVTAFCRRAMAERRGVLLIEGIGGVMVPLDDRHTVLDLMSVLRIPVILVAGSYVGTLSHTLTALEVLARRNLDIAAVVVSESAGSAASLEDTLATLRQFAGSIDIVGIPRLMGGADDDRAFAPLAALL
jgi:dethiobiotin synthetase